MRPNGELGLMGFVCVVLVWVCGRMFVCMLGLGVCGVDLNEISKHKSCVFRNY